MEDGAHQLWEQELLLQHVLARGRSHGSAQPWVICPFRGAQLHHSPASLLEPHRLPCREEGQEGW